MEITYSEESPPVKMAIFISSSIERFPYLNVTPFIRMWLEKVDSFLTNGAIHP
jgi:hypothetical protein